VCLYSAVAPIGDDVFGRADLHLHTLASDGLMSACDLVDYVERHTDLDIMAVTDHDETSASLEAREWAAKHGYRVQVVPGVEVTTREGHLLALFVEERPPALRALQATAEWVLAHGGLCVAPHPFSRWTHSLNLRALCLAAEHGLLAGVEVLNASLAGRASRPPAMRFVQQRRLAGVGSSDAHMVSMVGLARTRFPGRAPQDLRRAIEAAATSAEGRFATPGEMASEAIPQLARSMVHLPLRRIVRYARARRRAASPDAKIRPT
jgi:predicted metal-dependent phosphoesterase TrpH